MDRLISIAGFILLLILLSSCKQGDSNQSGKTQVPDSLSGTALNDVAPSNAPVWYVTDYNKTGFRYGKGTARSRRVTIARDKAILKAQVELSHKLELNSTDDLKGVLIKQQKQIREENLWRIFVLLEVPVDSTQILGEIN